MWQGTIYFGLYHKKFLTAMKSLETWGMGFSFRSKSLFSVIPYVGREFLRLPFLYYSLLGFLPLCWETLTFPFSILLFNAALIERG